jgi:hypothetical protein
MVDRGEHRLPMERMLQISWGGRVGPGYGTAYPVDFSLSEASSLSAPAEDDKGEWDAVTSRETRPLQLRKEDT